MDFPQYRKLSNDLVYYKINDARDFEELKVVGSTIQHFHIKATQYPEILRIQEMLTLELDHLLECSAEEYQKIRKRISANQ